jgi:hypothetical protein
MKKYVLIVFLALALLAIPSVVAAAQTEVRGTIARTIDVTVDDATLDLDMSNAGYTPIVDTIVHATVSGPISSWSVTAQDEKAGTYSGYLTKDGANLQPLGLQLEISKDASTWYYLPLDIMSGTTTVTNSQQTVSFRQYVSTSDLAGFYKITVLFVGVVA